MLGERNPLPQINAILATLHVPSFDETVSVFAATGARTDSWRTITTIGPMLSSAGDELRRRVLARLKFSGSPSTTLRDDYYLAYAFAASLADGEVHGALTVHRRHDRPLSNEQIQQFTNAAVELAPLLRDMRSIAATQSAATIDGLTGLVNRATAMDRLQTMLEQSRSLSMAPCYCSTSITSKRSTINSATRRATSACARSARSSAPRAQRRHGRAHRRRRILDRDAGRVTRHRADGRRTPAPRSVPRRHAPRQR